MLYKKLTFLTFSLVLSLSIYAQKKMKQDIGVNAAGLFIKNQITVSPSLFYRYSIQNYQIRLQLSLDGNLNSKSRNGTNNQGSFGGFTIDSSVKFEPGKEVKFGFMMGIQKNKDINNTAFSGYYGLDFIYLSHEFQEKGKGTIVQGSPGNEQVTDVVVENKSTLELYGVGLPVGINYKFGKQFYASLEAKFILAYKIFNLSNINNSNIKNSGQEFLIINEGKSRIQGIDFGIKPLTGLCIGMYF
jgi:hypothetical protein